VGRIVDLHITPYRRNRLGPKFKGNLLHMRIEQNVVMPERIGNFYRCKKDAETNTVFVRVADLCTLLAEVPDRPCKEHSGDPSMINILPLAHAFPVSWIAE
jgi:hypothetical protein